MGDVGSVGAKVEIAPGYSISYGQMTALAGDHFESIAQMRAFAAKPSGKESREEIEYALEWKLKETGRKWSPEAKAAQEARYYALAANNIAHFVNPETGDTGRSTASKAGDVDAKGANRWWPKGQPQNAIAAYRLHHVQAINEALAAGKAGAPIATAMAADAFGSHYLTDSFSGGHVRTERLSIVEYWNGRVPMFYYNFIGFMAEKVAEKLNDAGGYEIMSKDMLVTGPPGFDGALDIVRKKVGKKGKLQFGDIVALALHDYDNQHGVQAISEGRKVKLMGDGHAGQADEKFLAIRAVGMSVKDVEQAYALGQSGAANADSLLGSDGLFAAERVIPTADPDPTANAANPGTNWRTATPRDLLADGYFQQRPLRLLPGEDRGGAGHRRRHGRCQEEGPGEGHHRPHEDGGGMHRPRLGDPQLDAEHGRRRLRAEHRRQRACLLRRGREDAVRRLLAHRDGSHQSDQAAARRRLGDGRRGAPHLVAPQHRLGAGRALHHRRRRLGPARQGARGRAPARLPRAVPEGAVRTLNGAARRRVGGGARVRRPTM